MLRTLILCLALVGCVEDPPNNATSTGALSGTEFSFDPTLVTNVPQADEPMMCRDTGDGSYYCCGGTCCIICVPDLGCWWSSGCDGTAPLPDTE